jgi:hypothetical protein
MRIICHGCGKEREIPSDSGLIVIQFDTMEQDLRRLICVLEDLEGNQNLFINGEFMGKLEKKLKCRNCKQFKK